MRKKIFTSLIIMTFALILSTTATYAGDYVITEDLTEDLTAENGQGMPYWYPTDVSSFVNYHAAEKDYVRDIADIYTREEEAEIEEMVKSLREKYDADFVVYTDVSNHGLSQNVYGADYYVFNGFGVGETYSGMFLYICMDPDDRGWYEAGTGDIERFFQSDYNINRLDNTIYDYLAEGEYAKGTLKFFEELDTLISHTSYSDGTYEQLPAVEYTPTATTWIYPFFLGLVPGIIIALIVVAVLRVNMKTINTATSARQYIVPGSFKLTKEKDKFINVTVKRIYSPPPKSDSSSGGSSSFSSSSGSSFSGGGGKF